MADSQIGVVVENGKEKASSTSNTDSSKRWPTMKEITDPKGPFLPKWRLTFIVSCLFAVLLDPLFLYIPMINDDAKCMSLDRNLKIAAPVFRMVTDIICIVNIILQLHKSKNWSEGSFSSVSSIAKMMWKSYILIDVLAVLPLPQVVLLIFFSKMRGVRSLNTRKLLNFLVLVQYVPRVLRIYLLCKEPKKSSKEEIATWVKGVLNFFMYILASHVLGACWYFFAVQRIISCWQHACQSENGCKPSTFDCHDQHSSRNTSLLNDLCPVDPENAKLFDFGIFLDVLQSGILGSTDYPKKFSNCFWWGLRNLSSLGSNLQTSTNTWENLFATLISILGLLLFLYLIGNLQMYMQTDVAILESNRHKTKVKRAVEKKRQEVDLWLLKNGIPSRRKNEIMERVQQELAERRTVDVENILSILPEELQSYIKSLLPPNRLKKVPLLQTMDEEVLKEICVYLEPKRFEITGREYLSRDGEPLEKMIFIVEGDLGVERRNIAGRDLLYPGDLYGTELLEWASVSNTAFPATLPLSIDSSYVTNNDSVLFLTAENLKRVVSKFRPHFSKEITLPSGSQSEVLTSFQFTMLKKVPLFQTMDEELLKAICECLKPVTYTDEMYIIKKDEPLELMFFVLAGYVVTESYPHFAVRIGEFCGQELLDWPLTIFFPAKLPTALESARANGDVRILALMLDDWVGIVNKFSFGIHKIRRLIKLPRETKIQELEWWFLKFGIPCKRKNEIIERLREALEQNMYVDVENMLPCLPEELQSYIKSCLPMTRLKKVPLLQTIDEQVLKEICEHLEPKRFEITGRKYLSRDGEPLEKMIFIVEGDLGVERRNIAGRDLLYPGDCYGTELLEWVSVSKTSFPATLPLSIDSSYVTNNDSVLFLTAENLKTVVSKFRLHFSKEISLPSDSQSEVLTSFQLTMLKKVPLFQVMNEEMLKAICERLKPVTYTDGMYIIKKDEPLGLMFFVLAGYVVTESYPHVVVRVGEFCGQELLEWASTISFPAKLPTALESARANGDVRVLALILDDWVSVVNKFSYGSHKRIKLLVEKKIQEFELWLFKSGIPSKRKNEIMKMVRQALEQSWDVDVENIVPCLPEELQSYIKSCLPMTRLKKVPLLQTIDEQVLKEICEHLEPKRFEITGRKYLSRDGEPLEKMIFIVEGDLGVERRNIAGRDLLYPGDCYGTELLEWVSVSKTSFPATLPLSIDSSYVTNNDSVLFLTAENLKTVVSKFRLHFSKEISLPSDSQSEVLTSFQLTMLKKVPLFQVMNEEMLKAICERLKPVTYTDGMYIIKKDEPLGLMFFVLAGYVVTESYPHVVVRVGEFCGQELLEWASTISFPAKLPTALESARANGDVRVLALILDDWVSVVNKFSYGSHKRIKLLVEKKIQEFELWLFKSGIPSKRKNEIMKMVRQALEQSWDVDVENIVPCLPEELQSYIKSCLPMTRLKKVPLLQTIDEQVLKEICEHLEPKRFEITGRKYLSRDGEPLEKMIFIVEGDLGVERRNIAGRDLLYPGDCYGTELLEWVSVSKTSFPATLPLSIDSSYVTNNDSVLFLTAENLKTVVSKFRLHFSKEISLPSDSQSEVLTSFQLTMLKKVPLFQVMNEEMLKAICERLKPVTYTDGMYIIKKDEPLGLMFFVLAGYVVTESYPHVVVRVGEFCGQELLEWASTISFPAKLPTALESARANGDVRVLALILDDWVSVVNKFSYGSHKRIKLLVEKKIQEFELWLFKSGIPSKRKNEIMKMVRQALEQSWDVDVENIVHFLPNELQSYIKSCLPMTRLKKVPLLQTIDEQVLKEICEHLEPKRFEITGRKYLSRDGEPLEKMIFIVEGDLGVERRNIAGRDLLYPGDCYGTELLEWVSVSNTSFPATLPLSIDSSYVTNNDSILFLTAENLKTIVSKFRLHFSKEISLPSDSQSEVLTSFQLTMLKKVPLFQVMNEEMLKAICERLKLVTYTDGMYIIKKDEPLGLMFFVLAGYVVTESYPHIVVRVGEFCGQELLEWASTISFPAKLPTAFESARANGDVRVLALLSEDWVSVVNKFSFSISATRLP